MGRYPPVNRDVRKDCTPASLIAEAVWFATIAVFVEPYPVTLYSNAVENHWFAVTSACKNVTICDWYATLEL